MTATSALNPLDAAVYARLTGNAAFMAFVSGVFDDVPEEQAFPYVTTGEATENSWDTFGAAGSETMLTLHIWSRYHGFAEAQSIAAAAIGLLDNQVGLAVTGYALVLLNYESTQRLRDPDGLTRHLVLRFHVMADAT